MLANLSLLLIEDNEADSFYIQEILKDSRCTIQITDNLYEGIKLCHENEYSVVLLDLFLADSKRIDTFYTFQAAHPKVPVIVLTGLNDTELGIKTVKRGAQDYIVKGDINPQSLIRAIYFAYERNKPLKHTDNEQLLTELSVESNTNMEALKLLRDATAKIRMLGREYSGDESQPNN